MRRLLLNLAIRAIKAAIKLLGGFHAPEISYTLAKELVPVINQNGIRFFCPGRLSLYRARTLLTKEPETIKWIDGFAKGDVFWDIGANIGVYSLYAASRGIKVLAYEPAAVNYHLLNKNIKINKMEIMAYCIAFNDVTRLDLLYMKSLEDGSARHSFGEAKPSVFEQGTLGFSIDGFISLFSLPVPDHIKIDVDGIERKILEGAKSTMPQIKSILIESNNSGMAKLMKGYGLDFCGRTWLGGHPIEYNYIFKRTSNA